MRDFSKQIAQSASFLTLLLAIPLVLSGHEPNDGRKGFGANENSLPIGFKCGALAEVIRRNDGKIPKNAKEWETALSKFGFKRVEVSFSDALGKTDLAHPRYVYRIEQTNDKLPNLTNQLFVGVGTDLDGKDLVEFFSANPVHGGYDVGTIHPEKENPIQIESMDRCARCHTNQGPIFRAAPWSNTLTIPVNLIGTIHQLYASDKEKYGPAYREIEKIRSDPNAAKVFKANFTGGGQTHFGKAVSESKILKELEYQGVPLLSSDQAQVGGGGGSAPGEFQGAVIFANDQLYFKQLFSAVLPKNDRQKTIASLTKLHLREPLRSTLLNRFGVDDLLKVKEKREALSKEVEEAAKIAKDIPGANGPILVDHNHTTGKSFNDPILFLFNGLELPPSEEQLKSLLDYDSQRRSLFDKGKTPLPKELSPSAKENHVASSRLFKFNGTQDATVLGLSSKDFHRLSEILSSAATKAAQKTKATGKEVNRTINAIGQEALESVFDSAEMKTLYQSQQPPSRTQIIGSVLKGLDEYFSKRHDVTLPKESGLESFSRLELDPTPCLKTAADSVFIGGSKTAQRCARCHLPSTLPTRYIDDLAAWDKALSSPDPKVRTPAIRWLDKVYERVLVDKDMPPPGTKESDAFEKSVPGKELIEFLKAKKQ